MAATISIPLSSWTSERRRYLPKLLGLPRELRDIIYSYALLEPDFFSKRHSAFCRFSERDCVKPEKPPFANPYRCRCAKRQGLGLLLVNRQIRAEAAPIFWSKNLIHFNDCFSFVSNVDGMLQEGWENVRHVGIFQHKSDFEYNSQNSRAKPSVGKMWECIFRCENLQVLELEEHYIRYSHEQYSQLRFKLPQLRELRLVHLREYLLIDEEAASFWYWPGKLVPAIYAKISQEMPFGLSELELGNFAREFETNYFVHVDYAINKKFLGRDPPPRHALIRTYLSDRLKDNTSIQTVKLRNGSVVTLPIYGLPNSPTTRVLLAKQRNFQQKQLKAAGLPTKAEEELSLRLMNARIDKKNWEKFENEKKDLIEIEKKKSEQEKFRREQAVAEDKLKKNQRLRKQRKIRKAEELKKEERKRVQSKS